MARLGRPGGLSAVGKQELWKRWRAGESISDIARVLQKPPGSIHGMLEATGGISPPQRRRRRCALTPAEREEISRGLATGESFRAIAARLGRSASTVCREVNRNGGCRRYRAAEAEEQALKRSRRPRRCLLAMNERLRDMVARKLREDWSPEQISGWLSKHYPDDEAMRVSHETIYRTLFVQARGALKRELLAHLRSRRMMRRGRHASTAGQQRGQIKEAVSIRERPPEAEDRAVPGHWEGDLLSGSRNTHVATLVERSSRFVMLVRVGGKDTESVVAALSEQIRRLPKAMMATLTWDRGTEMAAHKRFTVATDVAVYFCDPKSPWQRATSENTNRLLRQYLPRKSDLSVYGQHDLDLIALKLNSRPRKTLGYSTPAATLARIVAPTG
ncbi:MAG: Transposase and inactivated derivatives, IS30 family [uncultured Rubrobacteraceae bacterium]|uniref:Transposase and inactivated derivatives, IS30 family n=1 Tax=uncultured Rubrobacteraceae bacterium TaxID=349277 RepID=A0A6J4QZZ1_9ACTN|nr:MAG: Transposase and inactivated derivatives, IS30 family [uncultured Rubrobacteraceae bacterium]